jgi:DNA-binding beta-propeller fold protein YncE
MTATANGKTLWVACASARQIVTINTDLDQVTRYLSLPFQPTGVTASSNGAQLWITGGEPSGVVSLVDEAQGRIVQTLPAGPGVCAPVFDAKNRVLYVCNRYANQIAAIDESLIRVQKIVPAVREPIAAVLTPDCKFLLAANHLPGGPANAEHVAATVTVIRTADPSVATNILLPSGSTVLRGIAVSPDGRMACVTHNLARFKVPTTHIERGWMNTSAPGL